MTKTKMTTHIQLGDSILNQRTVAGTVAGALTTHTFAPTPATFADVETAVWHVIADRSQAHAVADDLCAQARGVLARLDCPSLDEQREALDRALGL